MGRATVARGRQARGGDRVPVAWRLVRRNKDAKGLITGKGGGLLDDQPFIVQVSC